MSPTEKSDPSAFRDHRAEPGAGLPARSSSPLRSLADADDENLGSATSLMAVLVAVASVWVVYLLVTTVFSSIEIPQYTDFLRLFGVPEIALRP